MSLLFYALLAHAISTPMMADFITVSSVGAMVQIFCVPQAWVYVFAAPDVSERRRRLTASAWLEWIGALGGGAIVGIGILWWQQGNTLLWAYIALCMAGSTSVQGFLRGESRWSAYALWVVLPSVLRVSLLLLGSESDLVKADTVETVVFWYLLVPEGIRYAVVNIAHQAVNWQSTPLHALPTAFRQILRNWFYDVGSATVEVGDKYLISLLVSAPLLVVYFFVRKMSAAVTLVVEPFYAQQYRKITRTDLFSATRSSTISIILAGYGIAFPLAIALLVTVFSLRTSTFATAPVIPAVVTSHFWLFASCTGVDACIAANRWGRYVTLLYGGIARLLAVRVGCLIVFAALVLVIAPSSEPLALTVGFFCFALLELGYVSRQSAKIQDLS